jgi:hypothetical protein
MRRVCVLIGVVSFSVISLLGCFRPSSEEATQIANNQGGDPRLATVVPNPTRLRGIQSVLVTYPTSSAGVERLAVPESEAYAVFLQAVQEILSIKTYEDRRGAGRRGVKVRAEGSDGVLSLDLIRIREREGSKLGGQPAVVSFRMILASSNSADILWKAQFFYRQAQASEDVLSWGRGSAPTTASIKGFKSAIDIFRDGVHIALADLSARREEQFLKTR